MSEVATREPQLRFPEFSDSLIKGALGDYALIKRGAGSQYIEYSKDSKDSIRLIRIGDFLGGDAVFVRLTNAIQRFLLDEGDILIAGTGATAGITFLVPTKFVGMAYSYNAPKIKVHKDNVSFFYQYLISPKIKIQQIRLFTGNAQPFLDTNAIKGFSIFKPPLQEQQKIAAFLAAVDSKIEQLSKKQALLGEYKKGLMQQIFSQAIRFKADDGSEFPDWEDNTIDKALHSYKLGGNYSNSEAVTDYPLIKMGNLDRGNIKLNKLQYINTEENIDDSDKINYGDLFFNTRNTLDLVGKVAIWRDELPCAYYNSNLMKMEFSDNFFMNYRFNSFDGIKALRRVATGTTSVAAIYTKDLLKIKFSLPTLSEQQKIANFLSSIDTKIEQAGKQLDESKQFKKALLQQMFV